ncbi:MAG TPA: SEC-C metal-binding domain-containing protein, partial [Frankiaceae bacterium]|nr:SEC-C metal-binding domain-containing protein [Frankiaceae bacterium]
DHLLGNIGDRHLLELVALPQQRAFGQNKRDTLTEYCRDCDLLTACNGGCPKDRFATSPYGEAGQHYLCAGYQAFFRHVRQPMEAMTELLHADRAPADLMQVYAAEDGRRPRNDPCPCGSGRKWKRCHGAPDNARAATCSAPVRVDAVHEVASHLGDDFPADVADEHGRDEATIGSPQR